jgi:hypothetical protein
MSKEIGKREALVPFSGRFSEIRSCMGEQLLPVVSMMILYYDEFISILSRESRTAGRQILFGTVTLLMSGIGITHVWP